MTMRLWTGAIVGAVGLAASLSVSPQAETPRPLVTLPLFVTDLRGRDHMLVVGDTEEDHALGVAPRDADRARHREVPAGAW